MVVTNVQSAIAKDLLGAPVCESYQTNQETPEYHI